MSEDAHNWLFVTAEYVNGSYLVREHSEDAAELARGIMGKWDEAAAEIARLREALAAERERCARIADGFATCTCEGKYGRCTENDAPQAIAAAIRSGTTQE